LVEKGTDDHNEPPRSIMMVHLALVNLAEDMSWHVIFGQVVKWPQKKSALSLEELFVAIFA
jgi:hypothetical protein